MVGKTHIEQVLLEQYILRVTSENENRLIEQYLAENPAVAIEIMNAQHVLKDFAMEYVNSQKKNKR